jgi:Asp/Glu/hydantoin racemase
VPSNSRAIYKIALLLRNKDRSLMKDMLVIIHTMPFLVDLFAELCREKLPGIKVLHVLNEPLLEHVRQAGSIQPEDLGQLQSHISTAESIGANAVLVTCSTLSPGVDHIHAHIPVLKIDEAMIAQAVSSGRRIGVIATNRTTLLPTQAQLQSQAERSGKQVEVTMVLVENALEALLNGDGDSHDALVKSAIQELASKVDVIVLAQASMARVLGVLGKDEVPVPVLASPLAALERLGQVLSTH